MARVLNTLLARLFLAALFIYVIVAPLLYLSVTRIVEANATELFVNDVRAYGRFLADLLETRLPQAGPAEIIDLLDSIVLSHETTYAEVMGETFHLRSSLLDEQGPSYQEDFAFGEHDDDAYFLSLPLNSEINESVVLRLGFSEAYTRESLADARRSLAWTLTAFGALSVLLAVLLSVLLIRPLGALQQASQAIASGAYDEQFEVNSGIAEIHDLATDLESMRAKLVHANQRLRAEMAERMETERARAALERRLRHAQKLETIGTLAGGVAHEFNNVLVPIKLYTELALDDLPADSPIRSDLERVVAAATRAKNIVQKILVFSRQSHQEDYRPLNVLPIIEDAVKLARDLIPATISVQTSIEPDIPSIFGDETQIHQLVMNLLNNAYQAIGSGGGSIQVTVRRRLIEVGNPPPRVDLAPGDYVALAVSDTGHGLKEGEAERIFEPFYSTLGPGEGTGLGLSVAHGITVGHGGGIGVESEPGRGATFTAYFPVGPVGGEASAIGFNNVLYVASTEGARPEHRIAVTAQGGRARTVQSRAEVLSLLELEEETVDLLILEFGAGTLGEELQPEELTEALGQEPRVLLLGELTDRWARAARSWRFARQLAADADSAMLLATVREMVTSMSELPVRSA